MKDKILTYVTAMILSGSLLASLPVTGQDANNLSSVPGKVRYVVKDLGTLGGTGAVAEGINDRGWVVGSANLAGDQNGHAYLWRDGVMTDLGTLGGPNSQEQWPVNDNQGLVVGTAETSKMDPFNPPEDFCSFARDFSIPPTGLICLGFLSQNGVMTPLATLGGNNSYAAGVNNQGQAVGWAENSMQDPTCLSPQVLDFEAVIWGPEQGAIQELPPLQGDTVAAATGINDNGLVIGQSGVCSNSSLHGVLWEEGIPTDLGNLGGVLNTAPTAINSSDQVVGNSNLVGDTSFHTFLWTKDSGMRDLGTLPGDTFSSAFGINDKGDVVGGSCDVNFNCRAFLWQNGAMTDLNALVTNGSTPLFLIFGNDINSRGEIAAYACLGCFTTTPEFRAALVMPCDEQHTDISACNETAAVAQTTATVTVAPATSGNPQATLPEYVRLMLQRRLLKQHFLRPTPNK